MSTSFLYHGFGIVGYKYVNTRYENGTVVFRIAEERFSLRCPECRSRKIIRRGKKLRRFRTIPISVKPVFIEIEIQRVFCLSCQGCPSAEVEQFHQLMET